MRFALRCHRRRRRRPLSLYHHTLLSPFFIANFSLFFPRFPHFIISCRNDDFLWITNIHRQSSEHVYLINAKFISLYSLIMATECINEFENIKRWKWMVLPTNGENWISSENGILIWFWCTGQGNFHSITKRTTNILRTIFALLYQPYTSKVLYSI